LSKSSAGLQSDYFGGVEYRGPFDPVVTAYAKPKVEFIKRHVPLAGRILDVGCGNGVFTAQFAQFGGFVVGLDSSYHLLRQNPHHQLVGGDATRLPFDDATFDVVFEANVLHHVPDRENLVREMGRVSRQFLVVVEPNANNPIMFGFSLLVRVERGGLKSRIGRLNREIRDSGLKVIASLTTGMISQNNTPKLLLPVLRRFDRSFRWGEYIILIAEKV
jgi:SAM-dependent methyltransferase